MATVPCSYCKGFSYNYSLFSCDFTIYCCYFAGVGVLSVALLARPIMRRSLESALLLAILSCTYNPEKMYIYYVKYGCRVNPYVYSASDLNWLSKVPT